MRGRVLVLGALVAACDAGTTTVDGLYRAHPAHEAPMLFAPSRLVRLRAALEDRAAIPVRLRLLDLEPAAARAIVAGPDGAWVEVKGTEGGPWTTAPAGDAGDGGARDFALADAHLEALPERLAAVLQRNRDYGPLDGSARVDRVVFAAAGGPVRAAVLLDDHARTQAVVLDEGGRPVAAAR